MLFAMNTTQKYARYKFEKKIPLKSKWTIMDMLHWNLLKRLHERLFNFRSTEFSLEAEWEVASLLREWIKRRCSFFILSKILMKNLCQNLFGKLFCVSWITAFYVSGNKEHNLLRWSKIILVVKKVYWILVYYSPLGNKSVCVSFGQFYWVE